LENLKENRIRREQIISHSVSLLNTLEHLVNQTPAKYFPLQHWNHSPDIWIVGFVKSGTSQLYQILTHHPELQPFHHKRKEFCMDQTHLLNYSMPNDKLYASLYTFHEFIHNNLSMPEVSTTKRKQTVKFHGEFFKLHVYTKILSSRFFESTSQEVYYDC